MGVWGPTCKAPLVLLASAAMLMTGGQGEGSMAHAQSSLAGEHTGVGEGAKLGLISGSALTWSSMVGRELGHGLGPEGANLMITGQWEGGLQTWSLLAGATDMSRSSYSSGENFKAWLLKPCLALVSIDACMSGIVAVVDGAGPCARHRYIWQCASKRILMEVSTHSVSPW